MSNKDGKILILPGDGIGPEINNALLRLINCVNENTFYNLDIEEGLIGGASLIASEISSVGLLALELKQESLITDINIRFNTFMRFAIKHAVKNNEPRNLYNLAFHYSALLKGYVDHNKIDLLKQGYFYFKFYSNANLKL